ncbi:hypothetical protein SPHINGO361_90010 [Sphingomonas sp. EC-HK361]|nr:hypothetical protein SPHINGO361_90010 [Sphingomonas sp. EC-HK361]
MLGVIDGSAGVVGVGLVGAGVVVVSVGMVDMSPDFFDFLCFFDVVVD